MNEMEDEIVTIPAHPSSQLVIQVGFAWKAASY